MAKIRQLKTTKNFLIIISPVVMVREERFELPTSRVQGERSSQTELLPELDVQGQGIGPSPPVSIQIINLIINISRVLISF